MNSQFMTVPDAADRLGVHVETVRRWIRNGEISAQLVKRGQPGYRIPVAEVERMARAMVPADA